ncbi:MAG: sugar transferase [Suilimivivens sp.]
MKYECGEMRAARMGSTLKRLKFCVFGSFMREWDMDGVKVIATAIDRSNMKVVYQNKSMAYKVLKRLFDILLAGTALVCLSPIFLVTALAIKLEDGGTVFFSQLRVGKNMKVFKMYKFRSMKTDADKMHEQMKAQCGEDEVSFKLKDDPRITKVGKFIRKFNIDELPQILNILKGEMSIVGPRPLPVYEYEEERERYGDRYSLRYSVPQGLTCFWQISNRGSISFERRMEMDVEYAVTCNIKADVTLIVKTALLTVTGKAEY